MNKIITIFAALALPLILAFGIGKEKECIEVNKDQNISQVTFDGAEGNLYFFTDSNQKARQYEIGVHDVIDDFNLTEGNYVGSQFIINGNEKEVTSLKLIKDIGSENERISSN